MSTEHTWQSEDLMFRYHNDPKFYRFVQELIFNAIYRSKRRDEWPSEQLAYFTQFDASHLNRSASDTAETSIQTKLNNATNETREAMPAFEVFYEDGSSYITSMAYGVTLETARTYFIGQWFTQWDESKMKVIDVQIA